MDRVFFNLIRNVDLPCHPPLIFLPYIAAGQGMVLDLSVLNSVQSNLHARPPLVSDRQYKKQQQQQQQNFPSQNLTVGTSSK